MSDKTIADKMYLKTAKSLVVLNGEANPAILAQLPHDMMTLGEADVVLLFALNQIDLDQWWAPAMERLGEKGSFWIAFLKQTAPKATDLSKDVIFDYAKERGVTGVALISMDADWSAVRLKRI